MLNTTLLSIDRNIFWKFCLIFCIYSFIFTFAQEVMAQSDTAISGVLCAIVNQLNGPIGKGISTISIIVLGIGLFLGKLSWGLAVATAIGIGMIFGATQIVGWIAAGAGSNLGDICL